MSNKKKSIEEEIDSIPSTKKGILVFDLEDPYSRDDFEKAVKANSYSIALEDIVNEVFRPARKHGYRDQELRNLIDKNPDAEEIIGKLESMFWEILNKNNIELF